VQAALARPIAVGGREEAAAARERGAVDHLPRAGLTADMLHRALDHAVAHRRAVDRLRHDALHDHLTGLPNRTLFLDRLAWSLRRTRRQGRAERCAVLFLDVDGFKDVNDSLGHQAGDELLRGVAARLASALRPGDTVARLGGDEFTVLLEDIAAPRDATLVAERVQAALARPIAVGGRELAVSTSIGIALAEPGTRPEDLIRHADTAMYRAKAAGAGGYAVFDEGMHRAVRARLHLEAELRRAIRDERIDLRFQPIFRTGDGAIAGFEALCRWAVDPSEFVPIAEESGLIVPLGRFVLEEAARRAAEWGRPVAVNVSGRELRDPQFVTAVEAALRAGGARAEHLRLEVTEAAIGTNGSSALGTLRRVREGLGVRVHLDDFGSGASSLGLLQRFPGDALKIDRALVLGMPADPHAGDIVKAIAGLAHTLGLEVIAVGVESGEHLDRLKLLGCDYAQGFHLAAPLTADEVRVLLAGRAGSPVS
ncbi:MAG TPA: EAL domain-containing protein, partial [Solirubrobacteraceae bacterium]|nr:EAL domain-containing protein [Solirubrobacteraceae bacterium]